MILTRATRSLAGALTRTLTRLSEELLVFRPESYERHHRPSSPAHQCTDEELAVVRRQIQELTERRLLAPLTANELERYAQLCSIENQALGTRTVEQLINGAEDPDSWQCDCRL